MSAPRATRYPRIAALKTPAALRAHLRSAAIELDFDDELADPASSPLGQPFEFDGVRVGNRFCILPMEGWDGSDRGEPTDLTCRRWRRFGASGAKLIWGGEAVAVRADGRANPNQLLLDRETLPSIAKLRDDLISAHRERFGTDADADLYVGLQLTHSGRFSRPYTGNRPVPLTAGPNPVLDRRFSSDVLRQLTDEEIDQLVDDFVRAATLAEIAGFQFVDVKHCHGYFAHELLGARTRPGRYGGTLTNRTRFLRQVVAGIRSSAPELEIGVRLSVFDTVPYSKNAYGLGAPQTSPSDYHCGFGLTDVENDEPPVLEDARCVLGMLRDLGVRWICVTAGSPYYNPHVQRPALFPPTDGYEPPEDPLRGVARQILATAQLKREFGDLMFVGSAYSYLQEWLPNVAQHNVRHGLTDFVGLGRIALAYPDLPADILSGAPLRRKSICRTFSDCTSGPRLGLVSGCFPLDPFYAAHPHAARLAELKEAAQPS